MKALLMALVCCAGLSAQTLTFAIHDNTGSTPDIPLPSAYGFPSAAVGDSASIMVKITNTGTTAVQVITAYVGAAAGTSNTNANYSLTGLATNHTLAPAASQYFILSFTPTTIGQLTGYLQVATVQFGMLPVSTLVGTGTAPQLLLTYNNGTPLFPNASSRLDFGSVSTSSVSSIVFTISNQTTGTLATPAISINAGTFTSSAFTVDTSTLPASLPGGSSGTFKVTFAPGQTGLTTAILTAGANSYGIQGTGIIVSDIDALQISYVDSTGVRTLPQAATPISFGQLVPGAAGSILTFTVANPATSFNAVTVSALAVSGPAFAVAGVPTLPAAIQPGSSLTFTVTFSAAASGTYTGTLTIGTRVFALTGLAVVSPVPAMSFQLSAQPLTSAQQVNLTIQAATPSAGEHLGTLTMQFAPSVAGIADDPAVMFLATSGRTLSVDLAQGSQTATYQGQSALAFQTGTTAGTLTFTLNFVNTPPVTQSFTITPAQIHISGAQATRSSPNLLVTVTGFDNTYSGGKMAFTFYDLKGKKINSGPLEVDSTSTFHDYFFGGNGAGGSFAMQAKFPVTGDVSEVGSVAVTLTNSAGETSSNLNFQ